MQTLTTEQVKQIRAEGGDPPLINVLPEEAYREQHIPGTPNIPLDSKDFVSRVEQRIGDKDKPVVVYCASESCDASLKAAKTLEEAGFTHVFDYEGGTQAWEQAGQSIEKGETASSQR